MSRLRLLALGPGYLGSCLGLMSGYAINWLCELLNLFVSHFPHLEYEDNDSDINAIIM